MTANTNEAKTSSIVGGYDVALRARVAASRVGTYTDVTNNDNTSAWVGQMDTALRERAQATSVVNIGPPPGRRLDKMISSGGRWTATGTADYMYATTTTAWIIGANMIQPAYVAGDYTLVSDNGQTMANAAFNTAATQSMLIPGIAGKPAWAIYVAGTATAPASWTYQPVVRTDQPYPGA